MGGLQAGDAGPGSQQAKGKPLDASFALGVVVTVCAQVGVEVAPSFPGVGAMTIVRALDQMIGVIVVLIRVGVAVDIGVAVRDRPAEAMKPVRAGEVAGAAFTTDRCPSILHTLAMSVAAHTGAASVLDAFATVGHEPLKTRAERFGTGHRETEAMIGAAHIGTGVFPFVPAAPEQESQGQE